MTSSPSKMMSLRGAFALLRCDQVAIGGGGMFGNGINIMTSLLPVIALLAQKLGKQTVFLATGAYSSSPSWVLGCLRKVASRSLFVSVRDLESAAVLARGPATVIVDDPAIGLVPAPAKPAEPPSRALASGSTGHLGLCSSRRTTRTGMTHR